MRRFLLAGFAVLAFGATLPEKDVRFAERPGTNTHFTMREYKTLEDWQTRRMFLRRQVLNAAGLYPMPKKTPLNPQIFGKIEHPGYTIEKVALETMPGYYLAGNLYRPTGKQGKLPAILMPHGHWNYGRLENQTLNSGQARGVSFARQGYVVFMYDMVGYNDTTQTPHVFGGPKEQLWAFGPLGLQLWNSIRGLDFLESLPEVDRSKVAVTGESGGGTQTFLLNAVDDRISYAAPVNMVSAIMQGGSPCENAPGLRFDTFNVEIAAMFAPKPLLLVSATGDWTKNVPSEEFPAVRKIYSLYGKADNVAVDQIDAPHNYNKESREAVYRFFGKQILGELNQSNFQEKNVTIEQAPKLLVWYGRAMPANALAYDQLFEQWKRDSRAQQGEGDLMERMTVALGVEFPAQVDNEKGPEQQLFLGRPGKGDRVPAIWIPGTGNAALVVDPGGAEAARKSPAVAGLVKAGRPVLMIDAFQTGSAKGLRGENERHFLTFNRTNAQNRVQDILSAIVFLSQVSRGEIDVYGNGDGALWATFAVGVTPHRLKMRLVTPAANFTGTDDEFVERFFVPGIQRAGGWAAAQKLVAGRM